MVRVVTTASATELCLRIKPVYINYSYSSRPPSYLRDALSMRYAVQPRGPARQEEAHEIPMVIRMRDLRAADPVVQLRSTRCARAQDAARDRGCGDAAAAAAAALCGGVPVLRGA